MKLYDDQLIVVTGGAGFIGSGVVRHLNDQGFKNIVVVDEFDHSEKWKNLVGKQVKLVLDKEDLFKWLEGRESEIEAFIHLGACSSTVETDSKYLLNNNYHFSIRLAEYAIKNDHRFIYASSAATFGDGTLGFSDEHEVLDSLKPLNMYGFSKHLFDLWIKEQGLLNQVVGLKYFNVFGPNEYHKGRMASAIMHLLPQIQKEGKVKLFKSSEPSVYSDGEQKRDFIYVKDVARMTCAFLENGKSGIFNIGTGSAGTWKALAEAVFKGLNIEPVIDYIDMPDDLVGKYQNFTEAKTEKLIQALGKEATCRPLEDSVVEYVQDYLLKGNIW